MDIINLYAWIKKKKNELKFKKFNKNKTQINKKF